MSKVRHGGRKQHPLTPHFSTAGLPPDVSSAQIRRHSSLPDTPSLPIPVAGVFFFFASCFCALPSPLSAWSVSLTSRALLARLPLLHPALIGESTRHWQFGCLSATQLSALASHVNRGPCEPVVSCSGLPRLPQISLLAVEAMSLAGWEW